MNQESPALKSQLDHIVFASFDLDEGASYLEKQLGVAFQSGGEHVMMATHNKLISLGSTSYLEIIALHTNLPKPTRARWFDMDNLSRTSKPRLQTWVVRTNNIEEALKKSKLNHGKIETLQRGNYKWKITIPDDGSLPMDGIVPTLIEWETEAHPTQNLATAQLSLVSIETFLPEANLLRDSLSAIGFSGNFIATKIAKNNRAFLRVIIESPLGAIPFET